MGLFGSRGNGVRGGSDAPRPYAQEPGEVEVARTVACALQDGFVWVPGDLVLTDRRLLFVPLDRADVAALLQWGLRSEGEPLAGVTAVGDLTSVVGVERGGQASLTHPAALSVRRADGAAFEFGILKGRMTATGAAVNNRVRDRFAAAIETAVAARR